MNNFKVLRIIKGGQNCRPLIFFFDKNKFSLYINYKFIIIINTYI